MLLALGTVPHILLIQSLFLFELLETVSQLNVRIICCYSALTVTFVLFAEGER